MEGFVGVGRFQVGRTDRPGRVCRNKSRMKAGDSSGDGFQFDWDLMQKRISKVRNEEEEREKQYSSNWKSGKAKQEVAAYLKEDYFRRLKLFGPKLISGSHTGSIHMFNLRNAKKVRACADTVGHLYPESLSFDLVRFENQLPIGVERSCSWI